MNDSVIEAARAVLRGNDLGHIIKAGPGLYPHQWSWDSAFVSVALAYDNVPRALVEFRTLFSGQWSTGMMPHIVFTDAPGYFPGPDVWGTDAATAKPAHVQTSAICQPPVHATCLRRLLTVARARGDSVDMAQVFIRQALPRLSAWHGYLNRWRNNPSGLVEIHHGWSSGMDNSPRFDAAYNAIDVPVGFSLGSRRDLDFVDASERPSQDEYRRYIWLVRQLANANFDDATIARTLDFRFGDVFITAVLALAADDLAALADEFEQPKLAAAQRDLAQSCRASVASAVDFESGLCRDYDIRAGAWSSSETIAGFALLVCGGPAPLIDRQRAILLGERWMGHVSLKYPLPPSVSPDSPAYKPREYWRGPIWPIMNWYLGHTAAIRGDDDLAARLRDAGLALLTNDGTYAEYYQPATGEHLGSSGMSWTAMTVIDWLAAEKWGVAR